MTEFGRWIIIIAFSLVLAISIMRWAGMFRQPDPATRLVLAKIEQQTGRRFDQRRRWLVPLSAITLMVIIAIIVDAILE